MDKAGIVEWVKRKLDTKTWVILGLTGATLVLGTVIFTQCKHAALGKQVSRNVTKFLTDHGAQIRDGVISGGVVTTPMRLNTAINATVAQMLTATAEQIAAEGGGEYAADHRGNAPVDDGYTEYESKPMAGAGRKPRAGKPGAKRPPQQGVSSPAGGRRPIAPHIRGAPASTPLEIGKPPDDDGYMGKERTRGGRRHRPEAAGEGEPEELGEYNADEFRPAGARRPPKDAKIFSDAESDAVGPVDDGDGYQ